MFCVDPISACEKFNSESLTHSGSAIISTAMSCADQISACEYFSAGKSLTQSRNACTSAAMSSVDPFSACENFSAIESLTQWSPAISTAMLCLDLISACDFFSACESLTQSVSSRWHLQIRRQHFVQWNCRALAALSVTPYYTALWMRRLG